MSNSAAEPANRIQRILAFMVAGLVIVALVCFAISMIGYATGAIAGEVGPFWVTVIMLPGIALPVALVLTIVLLVVTAVRRSRANRSS
ncbi:hypothetical protein OH146_10270 [Salinibacterium sp. SYSU T00001]|uniref:hypothetical protein n=1 Tax=Homoserinimonas sedimenticola TaxID=2986805 RepID=UPI002235677E|nr:hypothetical protein [Salinibacterium sedimenticola]MCW4386157.1 hypothetical protein [Salinibacterium sedimenticola]